MIRPAPFIANPATPAVLPLQFDPVNSAAVTSLVQPPGFASVPRVGEPRSILSRTFGAAGAVPAATVALASGGWTFSEIPPLLQVSGSLALLFGVLLFLRHLATFPAKARSGVPFYLFGHKFNRVSSVDDLLCRVRPVLAAMFSNTHPCESKAERMEMFGSFGVLFELGVGPNGIGVSLCPHPLDLPNLTRNPSLLYFKLKLHGLSPELRLEGLKKLTSVPGPLDSLLQAAGMKFGKVDERFAEARGSEGALVEIISWPREALDHVLFTIPREGVTPDKIEEWLKPLLEAYLVGGVFKRSPEPTLGRGSWSRDDGPRRDAPAPGAGRRGDIRVESPVFVEPRTAPSKDSPKV